MDSMHERHSDDTSSVANYNVKSDLQGNKQKAFNYFKGKVDNNGN